MKKSIDFCMVYDKKFLMHVKCFAFIRISKIYESMSVNFIDLKTKRYLDLLVDKHVDFLFDNYIYFAQGAFDQYMINHN